MSALRRIGTVLLLASLASVAIAAAGSTALWTPSQLMPASELNRQLTAVKAGKIVLIQVGFLVMYKMGHIPGSQYAGPACKPDGIATLKKLVSKLPRNQEIVIYCGCCPWTDCPNVRPAFQFLKEMGFTKLKVLDIPDRLGSDWTAKGFPIVRGD